MKSHRCSGSPAARSVVSGGREDYASIHSIAQGMLSIPRVGLNVLLIIIRPMKFEFHRRKSILASDIGLIHWFQYCSCTNTECNN